jgi:hypothetical protein
VETLPILLADQNLDGAVSLYVASQRQTDDNLRAFIPAWSALELLINRLARTHRSAWTELLTSSPEKLPGWDKDLATVELPDYRMRDKFFSVACVLDLVSAKEDSEIFVDINSKRSGYYHEMDVDDADLPTDAARKLFRKYLKLGLNSGSG